MEGTGPDVKRPRHSYDGPPRMSHPPPISPGHANNPSILPAPSTYPGPLQQGPPPSPYHDGSHDSRVPVEPSVHSFVQQHSGHSTPRDGRFPHEMTYSRRDSASGTPRSPDFPPRSISMSNDTYQSQYPDSSGHLIGYQAPDQHMNGNIHHGVPLHTHPNEPNSGIGSMQYSDYGQPPLHNNAHAYSGSYGAQMSGAAHLRLKKGNRAQQACDNCRQRKAKCDEGRPQCSYCQENSLVCNYQSIAPQKIDRTNQMIIDRVAEAQGDIKAFKDEFNDKLERITRLLTSSNKKDVVQSSLTPKEDTETKPSLRQLGSPSINAPQLTSPGSRDSKLVEASPSGSSFTNGPESGGIDPFPAVTKQNTIAVEHNTAAQKLFRWPSIKRLLEKSRLKSSERDENYVMIHEMNKGPLRLYGRGQGQDPADPPTRTIIGPGSPAASSTPSDDSVDARSPASSPESFWGYGINPYVGEPRVESATGGLHIDNTLKLDPKTIDTLYQNYLVHLHILHPFIDEQYLNKVVKNFKKKYNPDAVGHPNVDALKDSGYNVPAKRKASDGQFWAVGPEAPSTGAPRSDHLLLDRSPTTAMVLLILALGKLCECREPLPGPIPTATNQKDPFYLGRPDSPSAAYYGQSPPESAPMRQSPSASGQSINASAPSPISLLRQNHRSPRSSAGESPLQSRNVDVVPGLAYYAQATDILGNLTGSTSLVYIQCCILAGLVAGQFANSIESLAWIQNAARTLCMLLNSEYSLRPGERPLWKNSVRFAFHTTSQLENDILAEIDLPRAGLHLIDSFPYPDGYVSENTQQGQSLTSSGEIMQFYSSQLHMRGILNQTQHTVYAPDRDPKSSLHRPTRDVLDDFINDLRKALPPGLRWDDADAPAFEILHARLRGKWYGAQYIIHRPYLHFALELDENGGLDDYMHRRYGTSEHPRSQPPPMGPPQSIHSDDLLESVLESAKKCIAAAQRSTTSFDGAIDHRRLTVTNIFGTSHAQFGNMLVLSAVYASKHLKRFISSDPAKTMDFLFARTIRLLRHLKPISATLGHDQYILECLRDVVLKEDEATPPTASFSSG